MRALILAVCLGFIHALGMAENAAEKIAETPGHEMCVMVKRIGEGVSEYVLDADGTRTLLWKSYWGRGTAAFSPSGRYLALSDPPRFDVLGPVLVFRIAAGVPSLVYQSPGNWDQEECHIALEAGGFDGDVLTIDVFQNAFPADSSRAVRTRRFSYKVDCARLSPRSPSYFDKGDPLYHDVNAAEPEPLRRPSALSDRPWPSSTADQGPGPRRLEGFSEGKASGFWERFPRRDEAVVARGAVRLCQFGGFTQMAINDWESTHPVRISEATTETLPIQSVCAELAGMDGQYKAAMRAFDIPAFAFMFWDGDTPTVLIYEEYDDRESVRWSTNDREAALIRALFRTFRSKPATRLHGTSQEDAEP